MELRCSYFICKNTCIWLVAGVNFPPWKNNLKEKPNVTLLTSYMYVLVLFLWAVPYTVNPWPLPPTLAWARVTRPCVRARLRSRPCLLQPSGVSFSEPPTAKWRESSPSSHCRTPSRGSSTKPHGWCRPLSASTRYRPVARVPRACVDVWIETGCKRLCAGIGRNEHGTPSVFFLLCPSFLFHEHTDTE